jgi:hypothetical protein
VRVGNMAVERAGKVGKGNDRQPEALDRLLDFLHVRRGQMAAGQQIDLPQCPRVVALGHQRLDHGGDRFAPALLEAAAVIGRRGIDNVEPGPFRMPLAHRPQVGGDIFAACLRQCGRADADHLRLGAIIDVGDRLLDVIVAAEDGGEFAHRRRLQWNGLAEVAHHQHQREGGATLAAVQQRQAALDAEEGHGAAERRAQLQRVDRAGLAGSHDVGHGVALTLPLPRVPYLRR